MKLLIRRAHHLIEKGIRSNDIVGININRSIEYVVGILGILKAGAAFLPIDVDYPKERVIYIIDDSKCKLLITENDELNEIIEVPLINPGDLSAIENQSKEFPAETDPDKLAYVIYTSGTTGNPKGVMISHKNIVNYSTWAVSQYLQKGKETIFSLFSSISFDLTMTSIFPPLISGNKIKIFGEEYNDIIIEKLCEDNNINLLKITPTHLKLILTYKSLNKKKQENIKCLILGGEDLESKLAFAAMEYYNSDVKIYNEYGPTETTVGCMIHQFDAEEDKNRTVLIGSPIQNTQIYILDDNLNALPNRAIGEIYVSGDNVSAGYLYRDKLNQEKFIKNPFIENSLLYRTGDLAKRTSGGKIEFLGRSDNQVKISGYRIELGEIESKLCNHPDIRETVVVARTDKEGEKSICAYYISDADLKNVDLWEYLSVDLPNYMFPSYFVRIESIPFTSNGKLDKNALPAPTLEKQQSYIKPRNEIEQILANLWSEVLAVDKENISIDTNFFEIGGNSLKSIRMFNLIKSNTSFDITIAKLFTYPTIRSLADHLNSVNTGKEYEIDDRSEILNDRRERLASRARR